MTLTALMTTAAVCLLISISHADTAKHAVNKHDHSQHAPGVTGQGHVGVNNVHALASQDDYFDLSADSMEDYLAVEEFLPVKTSMKTEESSEKQSGLKPDKSVPKFDRVNSDKHNKTRETRPYTPENAEKVSKQTGKIEETVKITSPLGRRPDNTDDTSRKTDGALSETGVGQDKLVETYYTGETQQQNNKTNQKATFGQGFVLVQHFPDSSELIDLEDYIPDEELFYEGRRGYILSSANSVKKSEDLQEQTHLVPSSIHRSATNPSLEQDNDIGVRTGEKAENSLILESLKNKFSRRRQKNSQFLELYEAQVQSSESDDATHTAHPTEEEPISKNQLIASKTNITILKQKMALVEDHQMSEKLKEQLENVGYNGDTREVSSTKKESVGTTVAVISALYDARNNADAIDVTIHDEVATVTWEKDDIAVTSHNHDEKHDMTSLSDVWDVTVYRHRRQADHTTTYSGSTPTGNRLLCLTHARWNRGHFCRYS